MNSRLLTVAALSGCLLLASATNAAACSCARPDVAKDLQLSDAAIVGRLVAVVPHGSLAKFRYRVKRVVKGEGRIHNGQMISVWSPTDSASCGLPRATERRIGLFLRRSHERWNSDLCSVVSPKQLSAGSRGDGGHRHSSSGSNCGAAG